MNYLIGLMSGTSFDGVDAVLVDAERLQVINQCLLPYSTLVIEACTTISQRQAVSFEQFIQLQQQITEHYSKAAKTVARQIDSASIIAVGAHGQTLYHQPTGDYRYSWQWLNGSQLAFAVGAPVVCDFRNMDIAAGGQGAPLAPLFHHQLFDLSDSKVVLNLGGIANISFMDEAGDIRGFDTGPANCLLDAWCFAQTGERYDNDGQLAEKGKVSDVLLSKLLQHPFFAEPLPKSAEKMQFSLEWLSQCLDNESIVDVQATLLELTLITIQQAISDQVSHCKQLIVCGGGVHNKQLMTRLAQSYHTVITSDKLGIAADYVEAIMMAWLAKQRVAQTSLDLHSITNSHQPICLGALYGG